MERYEPTNGLCFQGKNTFAPCYVIGSQKAFTKWKQKKKFRKK